MSLLPRSLRRLPLAWWLTTGTIAVVVGFLVTSALSQASAAAARYAAPQTVLVLTHDVNAGMPVTAADVEREEWPESFLPASPIVTTVDGAIAAVPMIAGEPLTKAKVGAAGLSPMAAQLREGERGVTLANSASMPRLAVGDLVDILAAAPNESIAAATPAAVIASGVRVVASDEATTTIAVHASLATRVAYVAAKNAAIVTLTTPAAQNVGTTESVTVDR